MSFCNQQPFNQQFNIQTLVQQLYFVVSDVECALQFVEQSQNVTRNIFLSQTPIIQQLNGVQILLQLHVYSKYFDIVYNALLKFQQQSSQYIQMMEHNKTLIEKSNQQEAQLQKMIVETQQLKQEHLKAIKNLEDKISQLEKEKIVLIEDNTKLLINEKSILQLDPNSEFIIEKTPQPQQANYQTLNRTITPFLINQLNSITQQVFSPVPSFNQNISNLSKFILNLEYIPAEVQNVYNYLRNHKLPTYVQPNTAIVEIFVDQSQIKLAQQCVVEIATMIPQMIFSMFKQ
ncbi:Hypothetical_protein [Hexamita inflata]|uniref:Hypothetical_protein n=1 Tax=Hexamita inflata TaxID=28002 RepID=A0AA86R1B6_9EUKA|nr:Hypothetical protein HINF_LOCUS52042 [Hexamita inflata]